MRALLLLAIFALVGPAFASAQDPCSSRGAPAAGIVEITGGTADTTQYLDDRNVAVGNGFYIYFEANGVWAAKLPGVYTGADASGDLQRGTSWCNGISIDCETDACWDPASGEFGPDLLIVSM